MTEAEGAEKLVREVMETDVWFRSCLHEEATPLPGVITGKIPEWLEGTLIRNGGGLYEIGNDKFQHLFDGLSLMHRFHIENSSVTYSNKFLRSDAYNADTAANRIVIGEFGTMAFPDPCLSLWQRFMSRFTLKRKTGNNCNVTICPYGDEIYAASEIAEIWKVDPKTLDTIEKLDLTQYLAVSGATAHTHVEKDGTVYNVGNSYPKGACYNIIKFPPPNEENGERVSPFKQASILATIPARWPYSPGYYHSFAITENYVVFIEQPMCVSIPRVATSVVRNVPISECFVWHGEYKNRFHVISKATGAVTPLHWLSAEPFLFFHTINAYEDEDHIVLDLCANINNSLITEVDLTRMGKSAVSDKSRWMLGGVARRFVLPLSPSKDIASGTNLVNLPYTKCSATWNKMNEIICVPEEIPDSVFELPRINYSLNGKKYKYFYATSKEGLLKINWETRETTWWREEGSYPMEPIFVEDPNGTAEDHGIVMSPLVKTSYPNEVDLLILDAHTFTELGRARFKTTSAVPFTFHGTFLNPDGTAHLSNE